MSANSVEGAVYGHGEVQPESEGYLLPALVRLLELVHPPGAAVFEIGAGSGWTANELSHRGFDVVGVEPSADGAAFAQRHAPKARIEAGSAYDDLGAKYGRFRTVFALEVIEHVYAPRAFVRTAYDLLENGGHLILSTPFHGYWKNLALALTGSMDRHFTALWDHGHIKFWSPATLGILLKECGFHSIRFVYAGRFYPLSKSVLVCAQR